MTSRTAIMLLAALLLPACQNLPALVGLGLIENNNYRTSGRSITGWAMSTMSDQDCEPMRVFERTAVCREIPPPPLEPLCYRTLAAVTCYTQPNAALSINQRLPAAGQAR